MTDDDGYFDERVAARYDESAEMSDAGDVDPVIDLLVELAGSGRALELGIGTGRIALPLAQRGVPMHGIELSQAMVARLRAKPGGEDIGVTIGDFATTTVDGTFSVAYAWAACGTGLTRSRMRQDSSMQIFLETERLVLRAFTDDDVDNLVELDSDPEVMRFINGGRATPRQEIESDMLPRFLDYYERFAGYGFWAAVEKSTGRFVGWFHFRPAKGAHPDEIELGYRLRKSAWGKGYATEGSRALIQKGFADLGVRRVVASTMVVNVGSRRVMEKAGLKLVRTFHQPWPDKIEGEEQGDVEYALLRTEWEQQLADPPPTG